MSKGYDLTPISPLLCHVYSSVHFRAQKLILTWLFACFFFFLVQYLMSQTCCFFTFCVPHLRVAIAPSSAPIPPWKCRKCLQCAAVVAHIVVVAAARCVEKGFLKALCGAVCFFFLFYRDVEGAQPAAQGERVYRPENYCWRQRVWSPPKCSSFLQLVFQGPGEKVCLRSNPHSDPVPPTHLRLSTTTPKPTHQPPSLPLLPSSLHQLLIQSVLFVGRIYVASSSSFFLFSPPFPPLFSCRCVKTLVPTTGPAAIPPSSHLNECKKKKEKENW